MEGRDFGEGFRLGYMLGAGEFLYEATVGLIGVMQNPDWTPGQINAALDRARFALDQWRVSRERQSLE